MPRSALAVETEELVHAFRAGDVERILTACAQTQEGSACSIVWATSASSRAARCSWPAPSRTPAASRTAGAGGGDSVWALSEDPQALERAEAGARELGFTRLAIQFPGQGLQVGDEA
ncbi:MAG: hypothetical protein U1F43_24130 [Myxococcota bacterium]